MTLTGKGVSVRGLGLHLGGSDSTSSADAMGRRQDSKERIRKAWRNVGGCLNSLLRVESLLLNWNERPLFLRLGVALQRQNEERDKKKESERQEGEDAEGGVQRDEVRLEGKAKRKEKEGQREAVGEQSPRNASSPGLPQAFHLDLGFSAVDMFGGTIQTYATLRSRIVSRLVDLLSESFEASLAPYRRHGHMWRTGWGVEEASAEENRGSDSAVEGGAQKEDGDRASTPLSISAMFLEPLTDLKLHLAKAKGNMVRLGHFLACSL